MSDDAQFVRTIDTYYNDVDINGHINSVKYIEHVLDLWDLDWYRDHQIRRFEIAYVAEAHAGDRLSFYIESVEEPQQSSDSSLTPHLSPLTSFNIRILKNESVEVCRSKVVFTTNEI